MWDAQDTKSAYASRPGRGTARQLKPGSIPFYVYCLSNWVWPAASQTELPLTFTVLLLLTCPSTEAQKQQSVSILCVPTIHRMVFVCWSLWPTHTHVQNCLPPMPACADINVCVKSCIARRPITASFTRQVTGRKTESVTEEIRWKKERKKNSWSSQRLWQSGRLPTQRGHWAVAAADRPCAEGKQSHRSSARLSG